jgi:nicotinate-nucleotide--dimethylbenzimidazole phosphoribosyltransferase
MVQIDEAGRLTDGIAVPKKSLGLLEQQVKKLMRAWKTIQWELKPMHYIFAADNGIVSEGVVRQSQEITYLQAKNMVEGKAAISCFCSANNIPWQVVDVGINNQDTVGINRKVRRSSRNFLHEPAMTAEEFARAYETGREMVDKAVTKGVNILSFGEMGIGNTTTSSAVLHMLSGVAPEFIVGYGANPAFPEVILRKRKVIAQASRLYQHEVQTPQNIIRCVGGYDIAALCGAMVRCAETQMPFVLDGFITAVAFACAARINSRVAQVMIPSHLSQEPGMEYALKLGGIGVDEVPLRARLALGEGTGAILEINILRTMLYTVANMERMDSLTAKEEKGASISS